MSKQPPPAPTASAVGPCPTLVKIVGRPGTGSLPSTIATPDHPRPGIKHSAPNTIGMTAEVVAKARNTSTMHLLLVYTTNTAHLNDDGLSCPI